MGLQGKLSPLATLGQKSKVVEISLDQLRADLKLRAWQVMPTRKVMAVSLLGCWVDSAGNTVLVQTDGSPSKQLTATLMKAPRTDINLSLWQTTGAGEWHCGDAVLDVSSSSSERLSWVFRDGTVSTWTWTAFTLEALAMRGLMLPQDAIPPTPSAAFRGPTYSGSFDDGMPQEWVPICVAVDEAF